VCHLRRDEAMLHLDLTTEEQQTLAFLLEECISDLRT
jgi:hypothetical protein